jgi:hypothetical protein
MVWQLLYGLIVSGGAFAVVVAAGLYIEQRWIGLPGQKPRRTPGR